MPGSLSDIDAEGGLICGYLLQSDGTLKDLKWRGIDSALSETSANIWLHFNLADMRAQRWLAACPAIPRPAKDILLGNTNQMTLEPIGPGAGRHSRRSSS